MPLFQIVFRLVAQLLARARDVVHAGRGIGKPVEVQPAADLHLRVRDVLPDDAFEVTQRHADAGADVVDTALHLVRDGSEINAERGVLVVDEVVLVVAALFELERQPVRRILDDAAHHRHRPVARGLARAVGRGEAQRHRLDAHVVVVIGADVLAHELGGVVDALGPRRQILGHRLPGRRAVFPGDRTVDALRAGEYHALDVECARRLQHVDEPDDIDLDAERRIAGRHRADECRRMHHVRHLVLLDRLQDARHVEHVPLLEVDLVDDVEIRLSSRCRANIDRPMAFLDELAARLGADDAHSAGDENLHLPRLTLLDLGADRADERAPMIEIALDQRAELRRRKIDALEAVGLEELARLRQVEHIADVGVDLRRPARRACSADPTARTRPRSGIRGTPDSAIVGRSGRAPSRFSVAAARIFTLPVFSCASMLERFSSSMDTSPASRPFAAGAAPR